MGLALPFKHGQIVVLALRDPKERIWGRLLGLEGAGVAIRGVELSPWEEILSLVKQGSAEMVSLNTRFLPMHRVENLYLDESSSGVPSLQEEFVRRTGVEAQVFLRDLQTAE